mgnify:CR=1 FL=1
MEKKRHVRVRLRAMEPEDLDMLYHIENDRSLWNVSATNVPYSRYALHNYIADAKNDIYIDGQLRMMIENRDAVTHRGIAVGDSMRKVLNVYGRPDLVDSNNRWFYGKYRYRTDIMHGIQFEQKGDKVSKILIYK